MTTPIVVLGIDAASPDLIRGWAAEGKLPHLAAALEQGLSGEVHSVPGYFVGSTWPSFSTGLSPAGHGFHRIVQLRNGSYEFFRPLDEDRGIGGDPFWRLASNAGRRVAVLDVPLTRLEASLDGIQIVEWGGHDSVFGFQTLPPELADEVMTVAGPYPAPVNCDADRPTSEEFDRFVAQLESAVTARTRLTLDLLGRSEWDLFMQVFTESHCVGHQCWHLHDPGHPAHDADVRSAIGDPLERVYRSIDRGIGEIWAAADDAMVLIVAAHGMSSFRGANLLLPEILVRLGVTHRRPRRRRSIRAWSRAITRRGRRFLSVGGTGEPGQTTRAVVGPGSLPGVRLPSLRFDAVTSPCFPIANGQPVSGIRLNLVDREPSGVLRPGPDSEKFVNDLRRDLLEIIDERTGDPLIVDVAWTRSSFDGPQADALPDILVTWNDTPTGTTAHGDGHGATIVASSPKIGTLTGTNRYVRTGDHIPDGWFTFLGPGVASGERKDPVSVMDFHPTLCALLGVSGSPVDGSVIPELV